MSEPKVKVEHELGSRSPWRVVSTVNGRVICVVPDKESGCEFAHHLNRACEAMAKIAEVVIDDNGLSNQSCWLTRTVADILEPLGDDGDEIDPRFSSSYLHH